ncbi:MAG: CPBP family intramembrane metalloprotease, partial [Verrucomicrobia bacterium]|nr:CPBP family intramembrane metalloprotease [Verrucomicrobiota bacterium]
RGALYGVIRKRWNFVISGLLSGFIFAAVHPQGILAIPGLTAAGFGFALIREWRGTVIPSMNAHAIHNGIVVTSLIIALS